MAKEKEDIVPIRLYKPENLILEELIKPNSYYIVQVRRNNGTSYLDIIEGKKLHKYIPAMYYFMHVLLERQHISYDTLRCQYDKTFVRMFARDIEPLKSKNYFNIITRKLKTLGIIEAKTYYEANEYRFTAPSTYYRFTDVYSTSTISQHEIAVKESKARKLNEKFGVRLKDKANAVNLSEFKSIPSILHQFCALANVKFDADGAKNYVKRLYNENHITIDRLNSCMYYILNISNGRFYSTYSNVCNRFFTTINGMPRELRQFILDKDSNGLVELDFGSSTAFAVYKILSGNIIEHTSEVEKMLFENEVYMFKRLLESDDFYSAIKKLVFPDKNFDRDQIKDIVIKNWFNSTPKSRNVNKKQIAKIFPRITKYMDGMKYKAYEDFFNFVMLLESKLVNEIIYQKFINSHPDAIIYTIFDSYLIQRQYADELLELMKQEGFLFYNVEVVIKQKHFNAISNYSRMVGQPDVKDKLDCLNF